MGSVTDRELHQADGNPTRFRDWDGRHRFERAARAYNLWPRCCLMYDNGEPTHGLSFPEAVRVADETELLINISGRFRAPEIVGRIPTRVYVDIDPGKTQFYHLDPQRDPGLDGHQHFFTVGLVTGTNTSRVPDCGVSWQPLRPPVVLDRWPARIDPACRRFTTISNWRRSWLEADGDRLPAKAQAWISLRELPRLTEQELEIAARIAPDCEADAEQMRAHGWSITDARKIVQESDYRAYIQDSRAEFSIANQRYVSLDTGWFSDRSARYLAAGKPVLVQSTGLEPYWPIGQGLLTFQTIEEAVEGIDRINRDYVGHAEAARRMAEEFLDSDKVLRGLLDKVGVGNA